MMRYCSSIPPPEFTPISFYFWLFQTLSSSFLPLPCLLSICHIAGIKKLHIGQLLLFIDHNHTHEYPWGTSKNADSAFLRFPNCESAFYSIVFMHIEV
jgi:hypothetical protein